MVVTTKLFSRRSSEAEVTEEVKVEEVKVKAIEEKAKEAVKDLQKTLQTPLTGEKLLLFFFILSLPFLLHISV